MSERTSKAAKSNLVEVPDNDDGPDFGRAAAVVCHGWTEFGGQVLNYAQSTLLTGMEAAGELRRCTSPKDIAEVQTRYARRTFDSYVDEMQRFGGLWSRVATDAIQALGVGRGA